MRIIFTILGLIVSFLAEAQGNIAYNYWRAFDVYLLDHDPITIKNSGEFKEARITRVGKKKTEVFVKRYNEKGQLTEYYRGKESDSIEKKAILQYDDKYQLQKVNRYDKHKLHHQYHYAFNEKGMITELKRNDADGEVVRNYSWSYNNDGDVEEALESKRNSAETKYIWKYEYLEKGKLSKVSKYKKGELKEEWDYLCNQTGELVSRKNLNKVCQWHESSKDTLTAIYQTTDDKGRTTKTIYKCTPTDTLPLAEIRYNHKNEITLKRTYDKSFDKMLSHAWYKNGKVTYQSSQTFSEGKLISAVGISKGKIRSRFKYEYNNEDQLTAYFRYGKKDKLKEEIKVEYTK